MPLQNYSLAAVQKVRQHIRAQLTLPPSEQQPVKEADRAIATSIVEPASLDALGDLFRVGVFVDEETPAPNNQGRWFISTIDPAAAISKLSGLSLKPRVRLVTYLWRQPGGGLGVTWALPDLMSTTDQLEAALETAENVSTPPHPKGSLGNVMDSIEGERTPSSFVTASLLLRELKELGRSGSYRRWSHHRLVSKIPPKQTWQWRVKPPVDLSPKVITEADQSVRVEFFSCRTVSPVSLFRHVDQYSSQSYRPKTSDQMIALLEKPVAP